MHKITPYIFFLLATFCSMDSFAQDVNDPNESAQLLHQNGQIYLVVLVLVTIFIGILFYLFLIEKKLKKIEDEKQSNN
ncbi:MAG TPA: CcmD family protein [Chitinophagaceae bacterium]|nr:CcmD family protein [Chitinophagaceae bacterium]